MKWQNMSDEEREAKEAEKKNRKQERAKRADAKQKARKARWLEHFKRERGYAVPAPEPLPPKKQRKKDRQKPAAPVQKSAAYLAALGVPVALPKSEESKSSMAVLGSANRGNRKLGAAKKAADAKSQRNKLSERFLANPDAAPYAQELARDYIPITDAECNCNSEDEDACGMIRQMGGACLSAR